MADVGNARFTPNDTDNEFNKIAYLVRQFVGRMSTMKLVKVVGVHVTSPGQAGPAGTVDVLPLVNQIDGQGNATPHGTVYGLPYFRMWSGAYAVIMDPQADDLGYVVCADRDTSATRAARAQANPGSQRSFDVADGVYVGGVLAQTPTCFVAFREVNGQHGIVLSPDAGTTEITITPGLIRLSAAEVNLHSTEKITFDSNGTGFVYTPTAIATYTDGVATSHHVPTPPEVPT